MPSKASEASPSRLPASEPLGTLAPKVRLIRPSVPLARPVAVSLPLAWSERSARSASAKSKPKSAAPVAKEPICGQRHLLIGDAQIVGGEALRRAREPAGDRGRPAEQAVGDRLADGEVGAPRRPA